MTADPVRLMRATLLVAALALGACATPGRVVPTAETAAAAGPVAAAKPAPGSAATAAAATSGVATERPAPKLIRGNDRVVGQPPAAQVENLAGEPVSLRFEQASVTEVVHAVLGDILGLDYTIHQPIAGDVTLHTRKPIPRTEVLSLLETVLQTKGVSMVKDAQGLYHVGRPEALKGVAPVLRRLAELPAGESLVILPLQYIGAAEMVEVLRPLAPQGAFVKVDTVRNLLLMAGSRNQIEGWAEIVEIFDVDLLDGMSVGLFPLVNSSVEEVADALKLLTAGAGAGAGGAGVPSAEGGSPAGASPGGKTGAVTGFGPLGGVLRILPIARLNAILVVTPRAAYLDKARTWIEKLDRSDVDGGPSLYVYPVQNGSAQHLATLLNSIFGGTGGGAPARDSGVAPGLGTTSGESSATSSGASGLSRSTGANPGYGGSSAGSGSVFGKSRKGRQGAAAVSSVTLGDDVRVVADGNQNALIIYAPRSAYSKIEAALRKLDVSTAQVLIEASIIEVTLTDELQYGLQWFFTDNVKGRGWSGSGVLTTSSNGQIASGGSGFSYTVTNPLGNIAGKLRLLADKSLIKVISSPSLMVLDNQTAAIQVGTQQPVKTTSTASSTTGITTESIEYKDTGVQLTVTPSINAGDMITMDLEQRVTDVGDQDAATGQRSFLERSITSKVAVRSGETIVLGGLIKNNNSTGREGVPVLLDLPVIGNLFGTTTINADRTELIVMITPRVVRNEQDVRAVGQELRDRMRTLKGFGPEEKE